MHKRKTKAKSRKKRFIIYGRIQSSKGRAIEEWTGESRSMATAMRQAILDIWERPSVRWKHLQSVTLTAQSILEGGKKEAA